MARIPDKRSYEGGIKMNKYIILLILTSLIITYYYEHKLYIKNKPQNKKDICK